MSKERDKSLTSAAVSVTAILTISKLFGFLRQVIINAKFGTGYYAEAFSAANGVPTLIQSLIMAGILATFIPIYTSLNDREGKPKADRFTNNLLAFAVLITAAIALLCIVFSGQLAWVFAMDFKTDAQRQLSAHIIRIMSPLLVFTGVFVVFQNYLNARKRHWQAQLTGFPLNIISIAFVLGLSGSMGIDALAWGTLAGTAGQALVLWYFARKDFKIQPVFDHRDKNLHRMLVMMLPALVSAAATDLTTLTDKALSSGISGGNVALDTAWRLNNLVIGSVSVAAASIVYTRLSQHASDGDYNAFRRMLVNSLMTIISLLSPIVVVACVMNTDIVRLVYERGAFGPESTRITAHAFLYYAPSILGVALRDITVRSFYAIGDTRTPLINGLITVGLNIALNFALVGPMGVGGLALATSISYFFAGALTATRMSHKLGGLGLKAMIQDAMKTVVCIVVQIFVTIAVAALLGHMSGLVRLVITALASLGVYLGLGYAINAAGIRTAFAWAGNRLRRRG